ncbi:Uncharacterised protein [Vibrio cholerae]|nr:Uncharacterised protein [Vibrio cholerae]CSD11677.1 Uncharacterised protein [Vibrio cholerae]CSE02978.1 Uncharacterised protein [Vibrio cholerae]
MKACMGGKLVLMNSMPLGSTVSVAPKIWVSALCAMSKVFCAFLRSTLALSSDASACRRST